MSEPEEHFNIPVFEGIKTAHVCHYRSEFELRLMQRFEAAAKVKRYHRPVLTVFVNNPTTKGYINVDFWIEYRAGKMDLLHIEKTTFAVNRESTFFILSDRKNLPANFGFVVINEKSEEFYRIRAENLKLRSDLPPYDLCSISFKWIN